MWGSKSLGPFLGIKQKLNLISCHSSLPLFMALCGREYFVTFGVTAAVTSDLYYSY